MNNDPFQGHLPFMTDDICPRTLCGHVPPVEIVEQAFDYWIDATQRLFLFLDTLRQRGNMLLEHQTQASPNALQFKAVVLIDGRDLLSPVNYMLMRILPPTNISTDPQKRPFIVFDPRAGQEPGVGGMKDDSEIGIALMNGHPVYFVSFLPEPVAGQTIEDISTAEALFVSKVIEWHPDAGKPCLIGNCQAGWHIALMSAINPNLPTVLILAGAPLSYWAGKHGKTPMRYAAGMTGGSWIVAMASDLGGGIFDGAWLIYNFEVNNPSNAFWKKGYNLYSKIDTECPRYLEFERWWNSPTLLGQEEIQFIVDDLFIGNRLSTGQIHTSAGFRADLRNIKSPIIVLCSQADDISPPPQALGWILDIYSCDDDIIANEQTIIYSMHENAGHLGIFVSSSVANKEHHKFISNIDMIETLPPGLYEAVLAEKNVEQTNAQLATGNYILRFERRSIEDIRVFGYNDKDDDLRFMTVARISDNLQGLYYTFVSPYIKALVPPAMGEALRHLHPLRQKISFFSDKNPFLRSLAPIATTIRLNRRPVGEENPFWKLQEYYSKQVIKSFDQLNDAKDQFVESLFVNIYSAPLLQAMVGLRTVRPYAKQSRDRNAEQETERSRRLLQLMAHIETGGLLEAIIRALLYVSRAENAVDEREFHMLQQLRDKNGLFPKLTREEYSLLVRQQYMMLQLDEERAVQAIPNLLDRAKGQARQAANIVRQIIEADGPPTPEEERRLNRLSGLFIPAHSTPKRRATDTNINETD